MPKGAKQKYKLYRVAQIMMEHTDEEHFITMPQLIGELEKYGITADRKSLYADLRDLEIMGIEVEGEKIGNGYHYHVINRPFELPELKLLVDAVQSSKFITEKKSKELIQKKTTLSWLNIYALRLLIVTYFYILMTFCIILSPTLSATRALE